MKQIFNFNYDDKNDVLYVRCSESGNSYGEEDDTGKVTFYNMDTDIITGTTIFDFMKKLKSGNLF